MHRYVFGECLGSGAFGDVRIARDKATGEKVAVKTFKDKFQQFDNFMAHPEVKALQALSHPNIIECKQYLFEEARQRCHLVFELMDMGSLERFCRHRNCPFAEEDIRSILFQMLLGLEYMHSKDYLHRDLKPENVLLHSVPGGAPMVKLADLGLAKHIGGASQRPRTTYVATRWYRSPEILLHLRDYGKPSDVWAIGAVMAEVVAIGTPLFPGTNERDQLLRVIELRGHPATVSWNRGTRALRGARDIPFVMPASLRQRLRYASEPVLQLIESMLQMNPSIRPTAAEALRSPMFLASPARTLSDTLCDSDEGRSPGDVPMPLSRRTETRTEKKENAVALDPYHKEEKHEAITRFIIPPVAERSTELSCNRSGYPHSPAGCFKVALTGDK